MSERRLSDRLRELVGPDAVADAAGRPPRVCPPDEVACATLLRTASAEGWRVFVEGGGSWCETPPEADLRLATAGLHTVGPVDPADLVATAQTGVRWSALRERLADQGTWLALDAPGGDRTLGSVLATATAGPLRAGYGTARDHVLGLTLVTADGRVVEVGGRVVKNVAGYDVAKLALGTFGGFGVITRVHLRLRAVPRADRTLRWTGTRDGMVEAARCVLDIGLTPAALELSSPAIAGTDAWALTVRLLGTDAEVAAEESAIRAAVRSAETPLPGDDAGDLWRDVLATVAAGPVTLRLGAATADLEDALDLVARHLDERVADPISVSVPAGTVRWSGHLTAEGVDRLRRAAAEHEWPVTVERGPADLIRAGGHFGAYREGVFRLVDALRAVFDPAGILTTPLHAAP